MTGEIPPQYLRVIKQHFPDIKDEEVQLLTNGVGHEVLLVRGTVFRFPLSEKILKRDMVEEQFITRFCKTYSALIPQITSHTDGISGEIYQTYPYIPGIPLTKEKIGQLSEDSRYSIASDMGKFLAKLHSFPLEEANRIGMESVGNAKEYGNYFKQALEIDKPVLFPLLVPQEWEWIEKNIMTYYALTQSHLFSLTVTHSDLLPKHILVNEETGRITGVIDFMFKVSDPAHDFKYFDQYGDLFLKKIYENYLPVDSYFEARRKFHARDRLVGDTYYAFTTETPDAKRNQLLRELKAYIATHPLEK